MKNIHIGEAIKQKVKERGISITDFANSIHCNRTNVYSIFSRKSIDMEQLMLISEVLDYNFISEVYFDNPPVRKYLVILEANETCLEEFFANYSVKFIKEL